MKFSCLQQIRISVAGICFPTVESHQRRTLIQRVVDIGPLRIHSDKSNETNEVKETILPRCNL